MKNEMRKAKVKEYDGNYMTVEMLGLDGDAADLENKEIMVLSNDSTSQHLPQPGDTVLLAFDSDGDAYCMGTITSDNQPLPSDPEKVFIKGGDEPVMTGDKFKAKFNPHTHPGPFGAVGAPAAHQFAASDFSQVFWSK